MAETKKLNRIDVTIAGQNYRIVGEEEKEHLEKISTLVNEKIDYLKHKNNSYSNAKVAVLAALQIADELVKLQEQQEKILNELDNLAKY